MFGNSGELSGLFNHAESQGPWIGTGSNESVSPDQVQRLVGQDRINQLANRAGISSPVVSAALARILPVLVDKLAPQGKVSQAT